LQLVEHGWFRGTCARLGIEDLVIMDPPPVPNFFAFWAGQCALSMSFSNAIVSTYQPSGASGAMERFFTSDEKGSRLAERADDIDRAIETRKRQFRLWGQLDRRSRARRAAADALARKLDARDLSQLSESELWDEVVRIRERLAAWFVDHGFSSLAGAEYQSMLAALMDEAGISTDEDVSVRLSSGLGDVESTAPSSALWSLAEWVRSRPQLKARVEQLDAAGTFARLRGASDGDWGAFADRFQAFLDQHGFRGHGDYNICRPDWSEDPSIPLSSLRGMVEADASASPAVRLRRTEAERRTAEAEYRALLPASKRRRYDQYVEKIRLYSRMRERTKATLVRVVRPARRYLMELAQRFADRGLLTEPGDIAFLLHDQVISAVEGQLTPDRAKAAVARHRRQFEEMADYVLSDNCTGLPVIRKRAEPEAATKTLRGMGVSPGTATGAARVITSLEGDVQAEIHPGEILVAPMTDAPWTPLLIAAAAIVVETGGILSHASTVAQEFGVPGVSSWASASVGGWIVTTATMPGPTMRRRIPTFASHH
jgi:pyruvate,water dikinase